MKSKKFKDMVIKEIRTILNEMSIREIKGRIFDILQLEEVEQYKMDEFTYENIPISIFEQNGVLLFHLKQYSNSSEIVTFDLGININPIKKVVDVFLQKNGIFSEDAVSKAQAKLFRVARAVKDRKLNPRDAGDRAINIARKVQRHKIDKFANTDDTYLPDRVPPKMREGLDEYAGINIMPANGQSMMGVTGDASFFGPDAKMKGGKKRSIYKTPKSSVHAQDKYEDDLPPEFSDDDDQDGKGKKSYINDKSVPKNSIHNQKFGEVDEDAGFPSSGPGGTVGDASFIGASGIRKGANSRKPIFKTPKSSMHYKKGRFPDEADFYNDDNWETDKSGPSTDVSGKRRYVGNKTVPKDSIHYDEIPDEERTNSQTMEQLGMPVSADGTIDGGVKKKKKFADSEKYGYPDNDTKEGKGRLFSKEELLKTYKEKKDYDTNIVPKTSIHYGERDTVPGEEKMKFEKTITKKAGFVPDEFQNMEVEGDWKSNLNKAVMDLSDEAKVQEPSIPVPQVPIGDTPEFPDAPEPESESSGCGLGFGEPSNGEIDMSCNQKPLIKKLMMYIKNEQRNLQEGISLKGLYEGKVVKLNKIFEGEHRRFKTFVKTNEGKVIKVHFGPSLNEDCGKKHRKKI